MKEPTLKSPDADVSVPGRQKVPGGKALARLLDFQARRGRQASYAEAEESAADIAPAELCGKPQAATGAVTTAAVGMAPPDAAGGPGAASLYLQARRSMQISAADMAAAAMVSQAWRPLGPFSIPHGQTYGGGAGSRPSVSGRISAVAVDPQNRKHLLIGSGGGGLWQSFDAGRSWTAVADELPSLSIGALAFDPSDPDLVYAGTGEGDTRSWLGVGLLRSSDRGTTWELHAETPFQGVSFFDLLVDPLDGSRLWAATSDGLFASTDGGETWQSHHGEMTFDLSIEAADPGNPSAPRELLAGCRDGILQSEASSGAWQPLDVPGLPQLLNRMEVCHAPSERGVAYLVGTGGPETGSGPTAYFLRRSGAGQAFQAIETPPGLKTGQSWYDWHAAVDPDDAGRLYVGAIELHRGERSAGGDFQWQNISARQAGSSIHPDQHAMAFDPTDPSAIFAANDGGLYASPDRGASWTSLNQGLAITEFQFIADHRDHDAWMIGGTQDNGTLRYEGLGLWHHVQDGDGGDCGASDQDPYTCFHTFYGMGMERSEDGGGWGTWDYIGPFVSSSENYPGGALFYPPVEVHGSLVVQAGRMVRLSSDLGERWRKIRLPAAARRASAVAIRDENTVFVGTERGHVYRIDRIDGIWRKAKALGFPTTGFISDLMIDPSDATRLWATCSDLWQPGVFRSDDGGETWSRRDGGLPSIPINAIEVDPTSPDTVFAAADVGVHRSLDGGDSWAPFADGLPNALVKDLLFHAPSRLLRAATQSRGVWEVAVDQATQPDVELFLRDSVVDTGRRTPSPSGVADPFVKGEIANWWHCPDIKVDAGPFETASLDDVDFELFGDDRDLVDEGRQFRAGLVHEPAKRGRTARVYVQVNNRGIAAAKDVQVRVFAADFVQFLPFLEDDFWQDVFDRVPGADAEWQPVADAATIGSIDGGRSRVIGFEWDVLAGAADHIVLFAIASAENDELEAAGNRTSVTAPNLRKAGLKLIRIDDP